jgi:hypothetical protein
VATDSYSGFIGPWSFGSRLFTFPSSGSGDIVGIDRAGNVIYVPAGYASDGALFDTSTYAGQSFSSLGVTPGSYVWTWGSGAHADSFTLDIVAGTVPEPSSLPLLMPLGVLCCSPPGTAGPPASLAGAARGARIGSTGARHHFPANSRI